MHSDYWLVATSTDSPATWLFGCEPRRIVNIQNTTRGTRRLRRTGSKASGGTKNVGGPRAAWRINRGRLKVMPSKSAKVGN